MAFGALATADRGRRQQEKGDSAMSALLNLIYREYCRARVAEMCNRRALMSAELVAAGSKETCGA